VGTGFWRAPEILLGVKNRDVQPSFFTEKSDVYSYAMTCYEILTGNIPLEGVQVNDYAGVLRGARPKLPTDMEPWIQLYLGRCSHPDPFQRPSFTQIVDLLAYRDSLHKLFNTGPKLL
jgi:serine/threonine protein kinase